MSAGAGCGCGSGSMASSGSACGSGCGGSACACGSSGRLTPESRSQAMGQTEILHNVGGATGRPHRVEAATTGGLLLPRSDLEPECGSGPDLGAVSEKPPHEYLGRGSRKGGPHPYRPRVRWVERADQPSLLLPDPIGSLPDGPEAAAILVERIRQAKMAASTRDGTPDPLQGLTRRRNRAPQPPPPPPGLGPAVGGLASGWSLDLTPVVPFEYGEVSFQIPVSFVLAHASGRGVRRSTASETLDVLWGDWVGAIRTNGTDWANLHAVIGCYDLEIAPEQYTFWDEGWGAPHRILLYALQMLVVFNRYIVDRESQNPCGVGQDFGDMIRDILTGEPAVHSAWSYKESIRGVAIQSTFRIHFLAYDPRFSGVIDDSGQDCYVSADGDAGGCGIPYDQWDALWTAGRVGHYYCGEGYSIDSSGLKTGLGTHGLDRNGTPKTGCPFGANAGSLPDHIRMQPSWLDFCGWLNDYLMTWARIALDYYYETGDIAYFIAADKLAHHVLAQILHWAGHIVHEFGHVHCGGSHCCYSGLYQEHARGRFQCAVRAALGLYADSVDLSPLPDRQDTCHITDNLAGYGDSNLSWNDCTTRDCSDCATRDGWTQFSGDSHAQQLCRIGIEGPPFTQCASYGDDWFFCRTMCTGSTQSAWSTSNCWDVAVSDFIEAEYADGKRAAWKTWRSCGTTHQPPGGLDGSPSVLQRS